ncbi:MAG TPA: putative molybdenum carrier protein [Nitrospirota bacterium]|nr:putative molybdenum carrier protein [Nitrospirota bacterium]
MKIISGGQTGADRAALDVAIELGLAYGGSIPKGRLAEDGPIDAQKYPKLTELESEEYLVRTKKNAQDADTTLVITDGALSGGTRATIEFAKKMGKNYLWINLKEVTREEAIAKIIEWLNKQKPIVLNVAGPRESGAPGIYSKVHGILMAVFQQMMNA